MSLSHSQPRPANPEFTTPVQPNTAESGCSVSAQPDSAVSETPERRQHNLLIQIYKRLTLLYGVSPSRLHSAAAAAIDVSWRAGDPRERESFRALFNHAMPDVDRYFLTLCRYADKWPPALPLPLSARVPWDVPLYPETCLYGSDELLDVFRTEIENEVYPVEPAPGASPEPKGSPPRDLEVTDADASDRRMSACPSDAEPAILNGNVNAPGVPADPAASQPQGSRSAI